VSQSVNPSINKSINQSINQPIDQSVRPSVVRPSINQQSAIAQVINQNGLSMGVPSLFEGHRPNTQFLAPAKTS